MSLTHVDENNNPTMVDVSDKKVTKRRAHARAKVVLPDHVAALFTNGDIMSKKGPVFTTAIIAGVQGAKKTSELIPFCHPVGLEDCKIAIKLEDKTVVIDCVAIVTHKTGIEMEALTGASVAALTVYDMLKGMSHDLLICETRLIEKTGGKSDYNAS